MKMRLWNNNYEKQCQLELIKIAKGCHPHSNHSSHLCGSVKNNMRIKLLIAGELDTNSSEEIASGL